MQMVPLILIALAFALSTVARGEQAWEIRGEFVALKPGDSEMVVLRDPDGRMIEVPVESLSADSQAAVRRAVATVATSVAASDAGGVTVRGPFGRAVTVPVPEAIKDVEADAIRCRTAASAADVYRLFLAGGGHSPERRGPAEKRLREWVARADEGLVRLGDRWVPPAEAKAAAVEAEKVVDHALELMRLGNADLAEDELQKASRIDLEGGRAGFVRGLSYALVAKNQVKAVEHFTDAVYRDPNNAAVLNNLAILEVLTRRYANVADHFREALDHATDSLPIAENIAWALKSAGPAKVNPALAKNRMPEKTVEALNGLYRALTQDVKLKPSDTVASPQYFGPDGLPCSAVSVADVAKLFERGPTTPGTPRHSLGFVVAPDCVVCPREVIVAPDGTMLDAITVRVPANAGRRLAATVAAAPEDGSIVLLKCEGLGVEPLPIAAALPPLSEVIAVARSGESWLDARPTAVRGTIVSSAVEGPAGSRCIHSAVVPRGLGGGPIVDDAGRVVAMVAATPRTDASGNAAGFGVPVERLRAELDEHLPGDGAADDVPGGDKAAAERRARAGTVIVSAAKVRSQSGASGSGEPR